MSHPAMYQHNGIVLTRDEIIGLARRAKLTDVDISEPTTKILRDSDASRDIERTDDKIVRVWKLQDAKYGASHEDDATFLANLFTGYPIPRDEPVFILRGQDRLAAQAIETYVRMATDAGNVVTPHTEASAATAFQAFTDFAIAHPERMKMPT